MARESKLAEISRIHNEILGVTVPLIDDVYFELIMQSEAIAQTGGSGVADLFDSGLNAVMAVQRSEAQVNLLEGILREDRKGVVSGKSVSIGVNVGGRRIMKQKRG